MSAWDESKFWPAFKAAGMLTKARVALPGCSQARDVWVDYAEPDVEMLDGTRSKQYRIEYQVDDLPTLPESTELVLEFAAGEVLFRVREVGRVDEAQSSGAFRTALLTRVQG